MFYSAGKGNGPLFDLKNSFNAKAPAAPSPAGIYTHTTRLGINLKSARPSTRASGNPPQSIIRQARSAPVKRPTAQCNSTVISPGNAALAASNLTGVNSSNGVHVATKSVTFVDEMAQTIPLYDEMNMRRSHTTASFGSSTKIQQLPLHPETDPNTRRFTFSCKSRIMPMPVKELEAVSSPQSARIRSAQQQRPVQPTTPSCPSTPRSLFMLNIPPSATPTLSRGGEQAKRYQEERMSTQRVRLMRTLSELQSHRIDRRYYVSGRSVSIEPRFDINEGAIEELIRERREQQEAQDRTTSGRRGLAGGCIRRPTLTPRKPVTVTRSSILKKTPLASPLAEPDAQVPVVTTEAEKEKGDEGGEYKEGGEDTAPMEPAVSVSMSIGGIPVAAASGGGNKDQSDYGSLEENENHAES